MDLSTLADIQRAYEKLEQQEEVVNKQLDSYVSRQYQLESKLKNITKAIPKLQEISIDAEKLAEMVQHTAILAENVSEKVRRLDTTRSRVSECQQRVHDLLDLQLCSEGVQDALKKKHYEQAAAHVHRFLSINQTVLKQTADDVAEDSTTVNNSFTLLQKVTEELRVVVTEKFEKAVLKKDQASVERFFKIYPFLNMHKEGIKKYALYLSSTLRETCKANLKSALDSVKNDRKPNVIFADTMTLLLEGTARVIETHQPLLDAYYGPGKLIILVVYLQQECDERCEDVVFEMFRYRQIDRKARQVKDHQDNLKTAEKLDPKALDVLLGELTLVLAKGDMYFKFIRRRVVHGLDPNTELRASVLQRSDDMIKSCELNKKMEEILGNYVLLEKYFTDESVQKALKMDTLEEGAITSSMVDDVFFIVRKAIRRAISSGSLDGVCTVINNVCALLETVYCQFLKDKFSQGYPTGYIDLSQAYNALQQGRLQASDPEQTKRIFLAHLNNADVSLEYTETLKSGVNEEILRSFPQMNEKEKKIVEICLEGLANVSSMLMSTINFGMKQLKESAVKPRINAWMHSFLDNSHELSEDDFNNYDANEPFVHLLITNIDGLLRSFKDSLTSTNYDTLVNVLSSEITKDLEKVIFKARFTRLGGLVLDKEIRALISFLTSATSWSIRDKFARLMEISTLLNLERISEISDWGGAGGTTKLSPKEVKNTLLCRTDFRKDEIEKYKEFINC